MLEHGRRQATKRSAATPIHSEVCDGAVLIFLVVLLPAAAWVSTCRRARNKRAPIPGTGHEPTPDLIQGD